MALGNTNKQLVITITNQNASTLSITEVNVTLPAGLSFITGSNITTVTYDYVFFNTSNNLTWTNSSASGLIGPGSFHNFTFNVSGPAAAGYYNITITVVDNETAANSTYVSYSSTPPQFTTYERSPATPHEDQSVLLNVTLVTLPASTVILNWNESANYTVTSSVGLEYFFTIETGNYTAHDTVTYSWYAIDSFGNMNQSAIQQFTVANQQPGQPTLTSPANYANISTSNFTFQYSATDADAEDTLTYYLYLNGILNSHPSFTSVDANLSDGLYNWSIVADDGIANSSMSAVRNFTVDTIPPQMVIALPAAANYSSTSRTVNYSYTETNVHSCWYQYNGANTSLDGCTNASFTALDDQQSTLILWINDTVGHYNSASVTFTVDTTYPEFSTYERSPTTPHEDQSFLANVTITETNLAVVTFNWNGTANYTVTSHSGNEYFFTVGTGNYTAHDEVTYSWYVSDAAGNLNQSDIQQFTVTNQQPGTPTLSGPANYANLSATNITLEFSAVDADAEDTLTYYIYINGILNASTTSAFLDVNLTNGNYNWSIVADDGIDNSTASATRFFTMDTTQPQMTIYLPAATNYSSTARNLNFSYTETNLRSCWYQYNGTNTSISGCTNITFTALNNQQSTLILWINDTAGNYNSASVTFTVDTMFPQIALSLPVATNYSSTARTVNYSYTETNVHSCWYQYNATNTSLSGCGNASFTALDNQQSTLILWVNDSAGNYNSSSVAFTVDTTYPMITITSPTSYTGTNYTSFTVNLNFAYTEANPNACWYQYNGTNTTITSCENTTFTALDHQSSAIIVWMNDSASHYNASDSVTFSVCTESWTCSAWSDCAGSTQTRTCSDSYSCGTIANRPALSQSCTEQIFGGGGGSAPIQKIEVIKAWDKILPGAATLMEISKTGLDFSQVKVEVTSEQPNVQITVTKLDSRPASVQKDAEGKIYQYVSIDTLNLNSSKIKSAALSFKVAKSWITGNNIDKSKIYLNRYVNGNWVRLATRVLNEDSQYVNYQADTPGFSTFAITGDTIAAPVTTPVQNQTSQVQCNSNGICDSGESLASCPADCTVPTEAGICDAYQARCQGSLLQQCSSDGKIWETIFVCDYGCANGKCMGAGFLDRPEGMTALLICASIAVVAVLGIGILFFRKRKKSHGPVEASVLLPPRGKHSKKGEALV